MAFQLAGGQVILSAAREVTNMLALAPFELSRFSVGLSFAYVDTRKHLSPDADGDSL